MKAKNTALLAASLLITATGAAGCSSSISSPQAAVTGFMQAALKGDKPSACALTVPGSDEMQPATTENCDGKVDFAIAYLRSGAGEDASVEVLGEPQMSEDGARATFQDEQILVNGEAWGSSSTSVVKTDAGWLLLP